MRLTTLYGLVGLVWGVLLGGLAAWTVMAMAAGVSWLYLFGDDPWPEAVGWLIPLIGLLAFLGVLAVGVAFGLRAGRRAERGEPAEARRRRVQGIGLLALGLLLAVALAGAAGARIAGQDAERALLDRQAAAFEALRAERQVLIAVTVARAARDMSYDMTVETKGACGCRRAPARDRRHLRPASRRRGSSAPSTRVGKGRRARPWSRPSCRSSCRATRARP